MNYHQPQAQTVSTVGLKRYNGPLGRHLEKQAAEKAAATLRSMRNIITELMAEAGVFTAEECQRCTDRMAQCECVARLQKWYRYAYQVRTERLLAQAVEQRTTRGRTADYAAELAHDVRQAEFTAETGLSYADILSL